MKRPNPLPPCEMTPAQRRTELCAILGLEGVHLSQSRGCFLLTAAATNFPTQLNR
jgi:hypothetical protein